MNWNRNAEIIFGWRLDISEPSIFSYFEWFVLESKSFDGKINSKLDSRIQDLRLLDKNLNNS